MSRRTKDAVDCTIDALREGLRILYRDAVPEVFTDEFWLSVDERARREVGGTNDYISKTPRRAEVAQARAVQEFARGKPAAAAASGAGISRASMYRMLSRKVGGA